MANQDQEKMLALSGGMADAVEKAAQYTVMVSGRGRMGASGIAIEGDLVLTANHVVERDDDIGVTTGDGRQLSAKVIGRDPGSDLAVLRVDGGGLAAARGAEREARVGQIALAVGRPTPGGMEASLGVVSAVAGPVRMWRGGSLDSYLRTDAIPYPGFSGGPLIDLNGDVLGINSSGLARGASLAIPAGIAWQIARSLAEHGSIKRGYLGIRSQLVEISEAFQQALGREQPSGLLVVGVERGSPAEKGGLLVGDILTGVTGEAVHDHEDLIAQLAGEVVGQSTPIEVLRGGQRMLVNVSIGEMPEEEGESRRRRGHWRR